MTEAAQRYRALDGLRGVAALLVVLYHVDLPNHFTHNSFTRHGYLAVDLFFILSGFVIAAAYSRRILDVPDALRFYWLRFFRIYPLHFAMLLVFGSLELVKLAALHSGAITPGEQVPFTGNNTVGALVANVFLLQGLGITDGLTWNSVSWSISCEFVAYLIFSIIVLSGLIRRKAFFAAGTIAATAGYCGIILGRHTLDVVSDLALARCLCGFFMGMLVFEFASGPWGRRLAARSTLAIGVCEIAVVSVLVAAMSIAAAPVKRGLAEQDPGLLLVVVATLILAVAVFRLDRGPVAKILMSAPIQFLGRISYSVYMVHVFIRLVFSIVLKRGFGLALGNAAEPAMSPWTGDALVALQVALVIATSALTYAFIEEPARRYGRRALSSGSVETDGSRQRQLGEGRPS